jgi:succinoglycan biosynthesis transport protein ExoP
MNLRQLPGVFIARIRMIAFVAVLTILGAGATSFLIPKTYKATTSLILNYKGADHVTGSGTPAQSATGYFSTYVATQIDIIRSETVATRVVKRLRLGENPAYLELYASSSAKQSGSGSLVRFIAARLLDKLEVKPSHDSSVLTIGFSGIEPHYAAAVANAFAEEYLAINVELDTKPALQAADYLQARLNEARKQIEISLTEMADFQQQNNITGVESTADVENARLSELSSQLVGVQAQLMEADSRRHQVVSGNPSESPDIANNTLIQSLKSDLSRARTKLSAVTEIVTPEHPNAIAAKAEVDSIKAELARQTSLLSNALSASTSILKKRERELTEALDAQKRKVFDINRKRTTLTLLAKEVENRKRVYDALSQRLAQTSIQGQAHQSDVTVLAPASAPPLPSNPRKLLVLGAAAFVGLLLGLATASIQEYLDTRVRSSADLARLIQVPLSIEIGDFYLIDGSGTDSARPAPKLLSR